MSSVCASCGITNAYDGNLCSHHQHVYGDDWAVANRIICDLLHRGIEPRRLAATERDDDLWAHTGEVA